MPDRQIAISTGESHSCAKWWPVTLPFSAFADRLNQWREVPYTPAEFSGLPDETRKRLKNGPCYVFGAIDATGKRQKGHILTREGLTYDLDKISREALNNLLFRLSESGYNYVAHSSASYDGLNAKVRVIIPFSRAISPEEYKAKALAACSRFAIPADDDACSFEDAHLFYFPTRLEGVEPLYYARTDGEFLDPDTLEAPQMPLERVALAEPQVIPKNEERSQIDDLTAISAVSRQVKHDWQNLQDRENYLSALMVLVSAVQHGEITEKAGEACAELLAGNNDWWGEPNSEHFRWELKHTKARTEYTFWQKFGGGKTAPENCHVKQAERESFTASEIQSTEFPEIEFFVQGMIPQGLGRISGEPKVGKSFFCTQLAVSVASGIPFLERETKQAKVIYYSFEVGKELLQKRLFLLFPDMAFPEGLRLYFRPTDEDPIEQLRKDIEEFGARLVIIDPHVFISSDKSNQKPLYEQSYKELTPYKRLTDELNITIILVSHLNKGGNGVSDFNRITGSVAERGATDFNILLSKNEDDKRLVKLLEENRKCEGLDIFLEKDGARFKYTGTIDELRAQQALAIYENDPVVLTIKRLLLAQNTLEITTSELFDSLPDYGKLDLTPQKLGLKVNRLAFQLNKYDQISVTKSRGMQRRTLIFTRKPGGKESY